MYNELTDEFLDHTGGMCVTHHYRVKVIVLSLLLATSNVSTVSQGIVRMQGLPFRATEDDIVSTVLMQWSCPCVYVYHIQT